MLDAVFDGFTAGVCFDASHLAAAAHHVLSADRLAVTDFAAHIVGTEHEFAVDDQPRANPCADINGQQTVQAVCRTKMIFTPRDGVQIIGDSNVDIGQNTGKRLFDVIKEIDVMPVEVGGIDDGMFVDVDLTGDGNANAIQRLQFIVGKHLSRHTRDNRCDILGRLLAACRSFFGRKDFKLAVLELDKCRTRIGTTDIEAKKMCLRHDIES